MVTRGYQVITANFFIADDELILERNDFNGKLPAKGIEIVS